MYQETRKIQLIEDVLKINNAEVLAELESIVKKSRLKEKKHFNVYDFVGILSEKEGKEVSRFIKENCETINSDDWK